MNALDVIGALPWGKIWDVVKAVLDLGLVVFAGTQVWIQNRERRDRRRAALAVVYADRQRLESRALEWDGEDLVAMAKARKFYHEGLAPPDWGVVVRSLGELGPEAAAVGSVAYGILNQVIRSARLLADTEGQGLPRTSGPDLEAHCKKVLAEVIKTLDDALGTAGNLAQTQFTLTNPVSRAGQQIKEAVEKRRQEDQVPSRFWATRRGRVLSTIGWALRPT